MWWGGGGASPPDSEGTDPQLDIEGTSPIPIRGRRTEDGNMSSGSLSSSYGSPSSDLRDLRNMRNQFEDQEELLGQIKAALQTTANKNKSQEKEDYVSRLAQMRQKGKAGDKRKVSTPIKTEPESPPGGGKKTRGTKMQVLRKQLEETKARQEAEAASRKDLEYMVSNLQNEISKRDNMIASLQLSSVNSSVISSPFVMSPEAVSPDFSPGSITPPYRGQSDYREQLLAKDNKILELSEQVADLGRQVFDMEENLREKDEIISARTQAVGLAAASVSAKGKNTLEQLEDTREQLKLLQERWSGQEAEWRKEKEEKKIDLEIMSGKLETVTQEKVVLEQVQLELENKGLELRGEVGRVQEELGELRSRTREERILLEAKLEELTEENTKLNQEIKEKESIHSGRVAELEGRLREGRHGDDEGRIADLEIFLAEREEEKGNLQLRILELEEIISTEGRMKGQLTEIRENLRRCEDDLESHSRAITMLESEKLDLMEALGTRDDLLTSRAEECGRLAGQLEEAARSRVSLEMRCLELEESKDRWEGERLELLQRIEEEKEESKQALKPLEELSIKYHQLYKEHASFKEEHAAALDRSKLYDTDLMEKYKQLKELKIEVSSLQKMIQEKNMELAEHFPFIEEKDRVISELRAQIESVEERLNEKEMELEKLNLVLEQSKDAEHLQTLENQLTELTSQLACTKQHMEQRDSELSDIREVKHNLEINLKALASEKSSSEQEWQSHLDSEKFRFENIIKEKDLNIESKEEECETLKEKLNSLVENMEKKENLKEEEISELKEKISSLSVTLTASKSESENKLEITTKELEARSKELEDIKENLSDVQTRLESLTRESEQKIDLQEIRIKELEQEKTTLDASLEMLQHEKHAMQDSNGQLENSLSSLNNVIVGLTDKLEQMEKEVELKTGDITALNEDILAKYKIIEDLQTELSEVRQIEEALKIDLIRLETLNSGLQLELNEEKSSSEQLRIELTSKSSAMETLQTVVDVLNRETEEKEENTSSDLFKEKMEEMQKELKEKNILIEELKSDQSRIEEKNAELRSKIEELEKDLTDFSGFTDYMNKLKSETSEKSEQILNLKQNLDQLRLDLESKDHEVTELRQNPRVVDGGDMVQLQQEQIEMLRSQLVQKADLLEQAQSDEGLKLRVSELTDELELRCQEVEDVKTVLRRSEAEKRGLEEHIENVEQLQQEIKKENSQHSQETEEKMCEIKQDLENKIEELNLLSQEHTSLKEKYDSSMKQLQSLEQRYSSLTEQGSPEVSVLITERDVLKDKNDKLKDMCKKYIAKLKQQEVQLKSSSEKKLENPEEEIYKSEIETLKVELTGLRQELLNRQQVVENYEEEVKNHYTNLQQKFDECERLEKECVEKDGMITDKDDLIRDLKQKLENAPENITVCVPEEAAHQQTKNELASIREKCKKLIVKVKQQDALLKQESARLRADSVLDESALEDKSRELEEEIKTRKLFEEERMHLAEKLEEEKSKLNILSDENSELKLKLENHKHQLEALETLSKEKIVLYDVQNSLKDELKILKQEKAAETLKVEQLQAQIRSIREETLIAQMQASPLLNQEPEQAFAGFEEDDGWASPDPLLQVQEDDGLMTPEPSAIAVQAIVVQTVQEDVDPVAKDAEKVGETSKKNSDGWTGWDTRDSGDEEKQGDVWSDDWGGDDGQDDAQEPGVPEHKEGREQAEVEAVGEREADIEDGWGDDTWGGFETTSVANLAANLRLSEDKEVVEEDGLGTSGRTPKREGNHSSPRSLALQCKVAEKEMEMESLEEELINLKIRFQEIEGDLLRVQDESDRKIVQLMKEREEMYRRNEEFTENETKLNQTLEQLKQKLQEVEGVENKDGLLQEKIKELENLNLELQTLRQVSVEYSQLQAKLNELSSVSESNCELEDQLMRMKDEKEEEEKEKTRLKEELQESREKTRLLQAELTQVSEELETSTNLNSDLQENLKQTLEKVEARELRERELEAALSQINNSQQDESDRKIVQLMKEREEMYRRNEEFTENETKLNQTLEQLQASRFTEMNALEEQIKEKSEILEQALLQVENLKQTNAELESRWEQGDERREEMVGELNLRIQALDQERTDLQEERIDLNKEVENLKSLVNEMSFENDTLQRNLFETENTLTVHTQRIIDLEVELTQLRQPLQNAPPPDVTNPVSEPDVARSSRRNPPDIMPGQPGDQIPAGQLDLVNDNAASWFDNFAANPQGNDWDGDNAVQGYPIPEPIPEPAPLVDPRIEMDQLRVQLDTLRIQLSEKEGMVGFLEREKVMLEHSQTQLLSDYKTMYEKCSRYEEEQSNQIPELTRTIETLRTELSELQSREMNIKSTGVVQNQLASFFGDVDSVKMKETEELEQLRAELQSKTLEVLNLQSELENYNIKIEGEQEKTGSTEAQKIEALEAQLEFKTMELAGLMSELENYKFKSIEDESIIGSQTQDLADLGESLAALRLEIMDLKAKILELESVKGCMEEYLETVKTSLMEKDESIEELRTSLEQRDTTIQQLNENIAQLYTDIQTGIGHVTDTTTDNIPPESKEEVKYVDQAMDNNVQFNSEPQSASEFFIDEVIAAPHGLQSASQFFEEVSSGENAITADLFVSEVIAPEHQLTTAAQFFAEAASGSEAASDYFNSSSDQPIYDPFSQHHQSSEQSVNNAATAYFDSQPEVEVALSTPENVEQVPAESESIMTAQETVGEIVEVDYQQEIINYQEAIAQWQAWGEQKSEEISKLQENLSSVTEAYNGTVEAYNTAVEKLNSFSEEKIDPGRSDDKVNEVLKLMKIKDMELEELKETIDRLETEKQDLFEELRESKDQLGALESASEQIDALKNIEDLLEETRLNYDKAKDSEQQLRSKFEQVNHELSVLKETSSKDLESLRYALSEQTSVKDLLQHQAEINTSRLVELERRLEEEQRIQEEAAAEFEVMQIEVVNSREQVSSLTSQVESMKQQCVMNEGLAQELEQLKLQQLLTQSQSVSTEEQNSQFEAMKPLESADGESIDGEKRKILELEAELESCKQYLNDWTAWSDTKNQEYTALLEAYNSYVEAYNTMSTEYNSLKESNPLTSNEELEALKTTLAEKEVEIAGYISELKAKEEDLVSKTASIAKMSISSHLGKLMVHKQEETSLAPEIKSLSLSRAEEVSIKPDDVKVLSVVKNEEVSVEPTEVQQSQDWDEPEGWGEESSPGQVPDQVLQLEQEISELRQEIKLLQGSRSEMETELNNSKLKNGKFLVKVKSLTKQIETLKKSGSSGGGADDLDKALEDEMNHQLEKSRTETKELQKELEGVKEEKKMLERKLEVLESGNERMVEMKEQQDIDVEYLRGRNKELKEQVEGLQWQIAEVEERSREELAELQVALSSYKNTEGMDAGLVQEENARLRQDIVNISGEFNSLQQAADSIRAELVVVTTRLKASIEEAEEWRGQALEAREEIESLKLHIDALQSEKGGSEEYMEALRLNESLNNEITGLKTLIQTHPAAYSSQGDSGQIEQLRDRIRREQEIVLHLEQDLQARDAALEQARAQLELVRSGRSRRESYSMDREISVFSDQEGLSENYRLKLDLDTSIRENRRLSSRIQAWEQELERTQNLDQEGLRDELSRAIKTLQIKDHRCEELTSENLILLEERDTLQLRLSSMMRQVESAASSRAMTPVPGGQPGPIMPVYQPQAQIIELHQKLEELRRLNYSLDVELQKERGQRESMQQRVMAPRSRQADHMLNTGQQADSPVKHL